MKRALIAASLALFASAAHAYTIDFGNDPSTLPSICSSSIDGSGAFIGCSNSSRINQAYGDVSGVVDVTYSEPRFLPAELRSMEWWGPDYNNLYGVGYAEGGDADSKARIDLAALGGPLVLTHFDLGAWPNVSRNTHLNVYDLGTGAVLFTYGADILGLPVGTPPPIDLATSFDFALASSTGFRIEFYDSAFNVGIDNITFDAVTAIPEPQTYATVMAGLALLGFVAKRRALAL
jgi:hypothetical protein